jgi:ABC-type Zn uptake system ZnuABC Zn-binding protein ZnuA
MSRFSAIRRRCLVQGPFLAIALLLPVPVQAALEIVTSIPPYAMLARAVAGPQAEVQSLVGPGQDPHRFDPTVRQAAALSRADLVIHNGAGEQWLGSHLDQTAPDQRLAVTDTVPFEPIQGAGGAVNGHVWLDPDVGQGLVAVLAARLAALQPDSAGAFGRRAARTLAAIRTAEEAAAETLRGLAPKQVITFHPSFDYFFRHYGWEVAGTFRDLSGSGAGGARLAHLLAVIRAQQLPAIFRERTTPAQPVAALARDAGVAVGVLDPLGLAPEIQDYPDLLRRNANSVAEAYER